MTKLLGSVYFGRDDIMASAVDHGRVRPHQGHRDSTEELARWLSLITTLLSGQSLPKSPHHIICHTMKSTDDWVLEKNSIFGKNRDPCSDPSKEAPQVQEEEIGRSPHGFVGDQHQDDKDIPNHADREDKAEKKFPVENS